MQRPVATALAFLMLVPTFAITPSVGAIHEDGPVRPALVTAKVFRDTIFDVNDTIAEIEEQVGSSNSLLQQAREKLKQAAQDHNRGNDWIALPRLMESLTLAHRAQIEHETRGASDPDAAFFSRTESKWNEGLGWIQDVHERMLDLQSLGVDLYMLDNALLAGDVLAEGERLYKVWPDLAQGWENGQRGSEVKNGLVALSYGPILYARVADNIITQGLRDQPEEPVGPTVGNSTLRGVAETISPLVRNRSVSFDRTMNQIVQGNLNEGEWLAGLGAMTRWSTKQASAAAQHTLDDPETGYDPVKVTAHLGQILENDTTQQQLDDLDVPGAHARYHLSKGVVSYLSANQEIEQGNETTRTTLQAAEGLGGMSGAHMSLAMIMLAGGESAPKEVVHLPRQSAFIDVEETDQPDRDEPDTNSTSAIPGWWWVAALVGLAATLFVVSSRRR